MPPPGPASAPEGAPERASEEAAQTAAAGAGESAAPRSGEDDPLAGEAFSETHTFERPSEASYAPIAASEEPPASPPHEYYDDPYSDYNDPYVSSESSSPTTALVAATAPPIEETGSSGGPPPSPPPAPPSGGGGGGDGGDGDDEEEGMVRMSFFDHLAELRRRLLYSVAGLVVAFGICLTFANSLWDVISRPAVYALEQLKVNPPELAQIAPMEYFNIVWIKLPLLGAVFVASPWLLYQLWAFIAPGLYKRERRWAAPFVISTAGLFILGGVFAYFVVFRFALVFLLGLGIGNHVHPFVSVEEYFDIFVNIMLGIGVVFELPVLIFFLTLIRVVTPGFLMRNIRYAILIIHIIAAVVTPTPDVFNMELFALPMCLLFFVGVGASYLLILKREHRRFPWGTVLAYAIPILGIIAGMFYYLHVRYGYHFVRHMPFFVR
ncbi:MAG TPA: twin-arginine translocase subunit TatC [Bryobacterales bacterium]|nr:twin-arginine translocase subunit TatC [Bryobacterales bacterium]